MDGELVQARQPHIQLSEISEIKQDTLTNYFQQGSRKEAEA
jgi:hypothetical protein